MLPKSLHTVRILVAVARRYSDYPTMPLNLCIRDAARVIGYPDASADDPLIVKAAALLAKSVQS